MCIRDRVWSGTFHSIFARILRVEAPKIGYPSSFSIYDTEDSKSTISEIIKELNLNPKEYNVNSVRMRISSAKSNLITPIMYERDSILLDQDRENKMPETFRIYKKYVQHCVRGGAMDFDDLLLQLFRLLQENPDPDFPAVSEKVVIKDHQNPLHHPVHNAVHIFYKF